MKELDVLLARLDERADSAALYWRDKVESSEKLAREVRLRTDELAEQGIGAGATVLLEADYSTTTVAVLLSLIRAGVIVAPVLPTTLARWPEVLETANPSVLVRVSGREAVSFERRRAGPEHALVQMLREKAEPGLILFTSGSTGNPKGVVHSFKRLLAKFIEPRPALRTLNFLLFDHWGGLNTLFHSLYNGGALALPENRSPEHVCDLIQRHRLELLPCSPTFLNLLLISHAYVGRDLSSLRIISYGSEPMPSSTLAALRRALPGVELRQTYGLIELGVLRAKSETSDSLWVKLGGTGYELRVVDGLLQIKAESAMLGYLNAPSPFTEDGYFMTGDRVEVRGDYFRILGRASELINVGGQKVFPAEVEAALLQCDGVLDAVAYGERHPVTGAIVCADIKVASLQDEREYRMRLKRQCSRLLDRYKVPVKVRLVTHDLHGDRLKRQRMR